jgi:ATP-dependent Clp protease ATP-binding subunit ClpB
VILLDEVEKAHPEVFNILLQVLDDGRLTDGHGRTVNFRNAVIVMTSNIGSEVIREMAGEEHYAQMKRAVMDIVGRHFRPEFINRIDEVVVFHPLSRAQIHAIAQLQLRYLRERLQHRDMDLELSPAALELLADAGFDPVFGARPLKRAIQQQVETPLARDIVAGKFSPGEVILVDARGDEIVFQRHGGNQSRRQGMSSHA